MEVQLKDVYIEVIKGDITQSSLDCIVNAANTSLLGGGGVDGAIHRAGGSAILEECNKIRAKQGGCQIGEAVITTAGKLKAKFVIHTVGPVWNEGKTNEEEKLKNCYIKSLTLAVQNQIESIAFPNISTGIYRFPKEMAADIAIHSVLEFVEKNQTIKRIQFICFDDDNYQIYQRILKGI
ncbi:O-acetyl-ADP-ribose deacetylase (regulator of RNase III) [Paenibacillus sp. BK033]|uniref:O-acetyl-ADP-ribose deacetylase n=1 Tax=Paenibacillus sp. BK033 TaxID=2512133 RepID=UPI00104AA231|nr:O-acetyl-ADP-ribose deacetylase [Paenibacillus sp. BK033]TCM99439.1 O-acetyl-ADP-ribose deacetylase (regulator of RNase III) [Paenibacillus sp. BK033]